MPLTTPRSAAPPLDRGPLPRLSTPRVTAMLVTPANHNGPADLSQERAWRPPHATVEPGAKSGRSSFCTLRGQLIEPTANAVGTGPIICRERLGGLLRFYHRKAA
jgi:hypothetical protein